jgi:hypothetical protein
MDVSSTLLPCTHNCFGREVASSSSSVSPASERCALRTMGTRLTPRVKELAEPLLIARRRREMSRRTPAVSHEGVVGVSLQ